MKRILIQGIKGFQHLIPFQLACYILHERFSSLSVVVEFIVRDMGVSSVS
jgi:hypothetical protein